MPKRVLDFDALWSSDKLAACAPWAQAEYAWLYGLADCNGSFELTNLRVIWGRVAAIRESLTLERLEQIFDEFIARGLLFTWEANGKRYGHWTGSDQPGRLPPPSWRARLERLAPSVPRGELGAFMAGFAQSKIPPRERSATLEPGGETRSLGEAMRGEGDRDHDRASWAEARESRDGARCYADNDSGGGSGGGSSGSLSGGLRDSSLSESSLSASGLSNSSQSLEEAQGQGLNLDLGLNLNQEKERGREGEWQNFAPNEVTAAGPLECGGTNYFLSEVSIQSLKTEHRIGQGGSVEHGDEEMACESKAAVEESFAAAAPASASACAPGHDAIRASSVVLRDWPLGTARSTSCRTAEGAPAASRHQSWEPRGRGSRGGARTAMNYASAALAEHFSRRVPMTRSSEPAWRTAAAAKWAQAQKDLRVGTGPVLGAGQVRPEVLERIRARDLKEREIAERKAAEGKAAAQERIGGVSESRTAGQDVAGKDASLQHASVSDRVRSEAARTEAIRKRLLRQKSLKLSDAEDLEMQGWVASKEGPCAD